MQSLTTEDLYNYMNGKKSLPEGMGQAEIKGKKSESDISYYRWDLEFLQDMDAKKTDNSGKDEIQIIFNLNRNIEWVVGNKEVDGHQIVNMKKGEVCIYRNNNYETSMHYDKGVKFQFKSLQMKTEKFRDFLNSFFSREEKKKIENMVCTEVKTTVITPDMYRILSEIDSADRYKEFQYVFLEMKMFELIAMVLYAITYNEPGENDVLPVSDNNEIKKLAKLRETIQLEPYNDYCAPEVASELNMSVSKLNRLFRQLYASSLHSYVEEQRLEYAAGLLMKGNYTVTEAAIQAGYYHMSHFSKKFKERFGITPKKFCERKVLK
ncbi:MAG: helix-turn-helix transcriptional regulator [Lachnospiraceae bacterium]|nr:helix-turn-helix transcriptional regulator [Lachnospiraceae bacterium]